MQQSESASVMRLKIWDQAQLKFSTAIASMATRARLLAKEGKAQAHSKASIFYGADEYLEELKRKYEHDHDTWF